MVQSDLTIYLASKSPRRKKLLKQLNLDFKVLKFEVDENHRNGEKPVQLVKRLASHKLEAAKQKVKEGIIITADTIVVINGKILGKPEDEKDAARILRKLSNRTHSVYTGFSIYNSRKNFQIVDYEKTLVTFRKLTHNEIENYIKTGSPMDKAGAYGIQDDFGAVFVKKINGCYYNVVGLPLTKLYQSLKEIV